MTDPELLKITEVARRLGVGRTTVYGLIRDGRMAFVKVGKDSRVPAGEVTAWVARNTQTRTPSGG